MKTVLCFLPLLLYASLTYSKTIEHMPAGKCLHGSAPEAVVGTTNFMIDCPATHHMLNMPFEMDVTVSNVSVDPFMTIPVTNVQFSATWDVGILQYEEITGPVEATNTPDGILVNIGDLDILEEIEFSVLFSGTSPGATDIDMELTQNEPNPVEGPPYTIFSCNVDILAPPPTADLEVTKTASKDTVYICDQSHPVPLDYEVTIMNNGPEIANLISFGDEFDGCYLIDSVSSMNCSFGSKNIGCTFGTLAPGESITFDIYGRVCGPGEVVNVTAVEVSFPEDTIQSNNRDTVTVISIENPVDLDLASTCPPEQTGCLGDTIEVSGTVTNNGTGPVSNVKVMGLFPPGLMLRGISINQAATVEIDHLAGTVEMSLDELGKGVSADFSVFFTGDAGQYSTSFTLDADGCISGENMFSCDFSFGECADLSITKTASGDTVCTGEPFTYTITVHNNGPNIAEGVILNDLLPPGMTIDSIEVSGSECQEFGQGGQDGLLCSRLLMEAGDSIYIIVYARADSTGIWENTANCMSTLADPVVSNNTATITTTVVDQADLLRDKLMAFLQDSLSNRLDSNFAVYLCVDDLPADLAIESFDPEEFSRGLPEGWQFAWADWEPQAAFVHPASYFFLSPKGNTIQHFDGLQWWPRIPDLSDYDPFDDQYLLAGHIQLAESIDVDLSDPTNPGMADDSTCALILTGHESRTFLKTAFENTAQLVKEELMSEKRGPGLREENILMLDEVSNDSLRAIIEGMHGQYNKIYFFYFGHGLKGTMVSTDDIFERIPYESLLFNLYTSGAEDICILLDACHSGSAIEELEFLEIPEDSDVRFNIITSSERDKYSFLAHTEDEDGELVPGYHFFTQSFLACFGDSLADRNGDGMTNLEESFDWTVKVDPLHPTRDSHLTDMQCPRKLIQHPVLNPQACEPIAFPQYEWEIRLNKEINEAFRFDFAQEFELNPFVQDLRAKSMEPGISTISIVTEGPEVEGFTVDAKFRLPEDHPVDPTDGNFGITYRESRDQPFEVFEKPVWYSMDAAGTWVHLFDAPPGSYGLAEVDPEWGAKDREKLYGAMEQFIRTEFPAEQVDRAIINLMNRPLQEGDTVRSEKESEYKEIINEEEEGSVMSVIDWYPYADFGHDVTYLQFNPEDSTITIEGEYLFMPIVGGLNQCPIEFNRIPEEVLFPSSPMGPVQVLRDSIPEGPPQDSVCALLLSGLDQDSSRTVGFQRDMRYVERDLVHEREGPKLSKNNIRRLHGIGLDSLSGIIESMKDRYEKIYFYYSGHGDVGSMAIGDDQREWIPYMELFRLLDETYAGKICIVLDCCFSGSATDSLRHFEGFDDDDVEIYTSSNSEKWSFTNYFVSDTMWHAIGAFTRAMLECSGDATIERDGKPGISLRESFFWAINGIVQVTDTQSAIIREALCPTHLVKPASEMLDPGDTTQNTSTDIRFVLDLHDGQDPFLLNWMELFEMVDFPAQGDTILAVDKTRRWIIDPFDRISTDFQGQLYFKLDTMIDLLPSGLENLGIVTRPMEGEPWSPVDGALFDEELQQVYLPIILNFSEWTFAILDDEVPTVDVPGDVRRIQAFPNPFSDFLTLRFNIDKAGIHRVELLNRQGKVVRQLWDGLIPPGDFRYQFAAGNLPDGMYFLRVTDREGNATSVPVVLQRHD